MEKEIEFVEVQEQNETIVNKGKLIRNKLRDTHESDGKVKGKRGAVLKNNTGKYILRDVGKYVNHL